MSQYLYQFLQILWLNQISFFGSFTNSDPHHLVAMFTGTFELLASQGKTKSKNFCSWYPDNRNDKTMQRLGETLPMSWCTGASEKTWHESSWMWERKLCIYTVPANTKKSMNRSPGILGTFLQYVTCVYFQHSKKWSQFNQNLFATHFFNEQKVEPTVINKANQVISFKILNFELMDIGKFHAGTTSLDFLLKA